MKRILVVDDSKTQRMIIRCSLTMAGYRDAIIIEAENGRQALALIKQCLPDFALLDMHMPEMNGIELILSFKKEGLNFPFAFITSETNIAILSRAHALGAAFIIAKPFTAQDLGKKMGPWLRLSEKPAA